MKNRTIRDRYAALTLMSQRTLPSSSAINKVSALLASRFQRAYDATELGRKLAMNKFPLPPDYDEKSLPGGIAEARQNELDAYLDQSQKIGKVPEHMLITAADLPKVLKGEDGWKNAEGVASIIVSLGSLYQVEDEERANFANALYDDDDEVAEEDLEPDHAIEHAGQLEAADPLEPESVEA